MPDDQDMTTGAYYDAARQKWIYRAGDTVIAESPSMAEEDTASAESWFVEVGWFRPLRCWSVGPLTCEKLTFKYVNAVADAGYYIQGKSPIWYWLQERKAGWNAVVRLLCRETCAHRR
ncbi:MAG TPA: hypothetical protein VF062_07185 [Candidatus Limnocylindrales bacterium]